MSGPGTTLVVSRFRVKNGMAADVRQAFVNRPGLVDDAPGFLGLEVFVDAEDGAVFYLVTRWTDEASFRVWHTSREHQESHSGIPRGLKLDADFTRIWRLHRVEGSSPLADLSATAAPLICRHFADSSLTHVLAAARDGRLLFANHIAMRRLGGGLAAGLLWDCLTDADAEHLRARVAEGQRNTGRFLLNFVDAGRTPHTLSCWLDVRPDHFVLIGEPELGHEQSLDQTLLDMNNELAVLTRETARQSRALGELNGRLEAELEQRCRTEEALRQSNRDLDHFASILSHDLMTPMNAITTCVHLLDERLAGPANDDTAQLLHFVRASAQDMRAMLISMLEYSRVAAPDARRSMVDSGEVLVSALAPLATEVARCGASVTHGPMPKVEANPAQLQRLFQNLLQNALKYRCRDRALAVRVHATVRDGETLFAVSDNASGMSPEDASAVFELFRRGAEEEGSGLGIGLAVCRRVVQQHGGRIWVESQPGVGSTFYFTIPNAL